MKKYSVIRKLAAAAALCALLAVPCGCGEDEKPEDMPFAPAVSVGDVSTGDASVSDVFTSQPNWFSANDVDMDGPVYTIMCNAEAINARSINTYMATIAPDSDSYDSTRRDAEYTFAHYRLVVSINDVEVEEMSDDSAVILVTQTTSAVVLPEKEEPVSGGDASPSDVATPSDASPSDVSSGDAPLSGKDLSAEFVPCQTVLRHSMIFIDGSWYISSTVPVSRTVISAE